MWLMKQQHSYLIDNDVTLELGRKAQRTNGHKKAKFAPEKA